MAQSGHHDRAEPGLLSGVKRTSNGHAAMSANDPERLLSHIKLSQCEGFIRAAF
jgi:hypothetical protein